MGPGAIAPLEACPGHQQGEHGQEDDQGISPLGVGAPSAVELGGMESHGYHNEPWDTLKEDRGGLVENILKPFCYTTEVRFRDLDALGHVNNAVYLTYLEQARIRWCG